MQAQFPNSAADTKTFPLQDRVENLCISSFQVETFVEPPYNETVRYYIDVRIERVDDNVTTPVVIFDYVYSLTVKPIYAIEGVVKEHTFTADWTQTVPMTATIAGTPFIQTPPLMEADIEGTISETGYVNSIPALAINSVGGAMSAPDLVRDRTGIYREHRLVLEPIVYVGSAPEYSMVSVSYVLEKESQCRPSKSGGQDDTSHSERCRM